MGIIDVALSQEGKKESGQNQIEYNKWYYHRNVVGGSYPYCAVFVSWCASQAGIPETIIPKTASVKAMYEFFLQHKRFHTVSSGYSPIPGDLMIQRSKGSSHIGIVVNVDPLGFNTVEGNSGNGVELCRHSITEPELTGFANPEYPSGMLFSLSRFVNTTDMQSDSGLWNYLKSKGYNDNATAALVGKIKQGNTRYYSGWHNITSTSVEFGIFNWKWTGISISNHPTYGMAMKPSDILKFKIQFPNTTLSQYITWCESKGYQSIGNSSEDIEHEFDFFFEKNPDLNPSILNSQTLEQATSTVAQKLGTSTSNDMLVVQPLYDKFTGKSDTEVSSTTPDPAAEKDMRQSGAENFNNAATINLGMYQWLEGNYTVKKGDTLDSIAAQYKTTPQLILWANNLNTWEISSGDVLKIPLLKKENIAKIDSSTNIDPITQRLHTKKIEVSHPTAYVFFYGEYGKLTATTVSDTLLSDNYADYDIISISTNRTMTQDCPTFSISLVWRNNWYKNLGSNDLVIIQLQRPPEPIKTVFFGLIDDIRKSMDFSSGQPQRSVLVTGRGFSKAFCQFDIGVISNYAQQTGGTGWFTNLNNLPGQSSSYNIKSVIQAYLDKGLRYKFSNGKTLRDYLGYKGSNYEHERLINTQAFNSFSGNIWNYIKQLSNSPFNETFWEIENGCPYIIHRPTPFDPKGWTGLNRIIIKDCDLVADNTGRSDTEQFSAFQVDLTIENMSAYNAFPPAFYPPYYEKYGIRMHSVKSMYAITQDSVTNTANLDPRQFTKQLADFNIKNNMMENGTLTVKGSNQYKIGERVILESNNMEYYVEGVQQSFNMYSNWTTSLSVTRGLHPEDRFTPPYGACVDLTPDIYSKFILMQSGEIPDWTTVREGTSSWNMGSQQNTTSQPQGEVTSVIIQGEGKGLNDVIVTQLDFGSLSDLDQNKVTTIALHETDSSTDTVEHIHRFHKEDRGWSGIGYHLYIRKDGNLYQGRPLTVLGAHVLGHNDYTIGISLEGRLSKGETPTDAQLATLAKVLAELSIKYNIELSTSTVKGHREFNGYETTTSCPGCLLDYRDSLIQIANQLKRGAIVTRNTPTSTNEMIRGQKIYNYDGLQWVWPTPDCNIITSYFGGRQAPVPGASTDHGALDISRDGGSMGKNIIAACNGKVIYAGRNGGPGNGYGNLIEILHDKGYSTRYGHMEDSGVLVSKGETVQVGQLIGKIGGFGRVSGPHLHFETRSGVGESMDQQGTKFDPLTIFTDKG